MANGNPLQQLNQRIVRCEQCPRLREHCTRAAERRPARFTDWTYWTRPVPNLVAPEGRGKRSASAVGTWRSPRLLVVGLAPAAHGANRTGRMFTGDRSGDFLFRAMYEAGFCNQPLAESRDDGLDLRDAVVTAAAHCAPPDNKPTPAELANCRAYLEATFDAMQWLRVVVCLGRIAHDAVLRLYKDRGWISAIGAHRFAHGAMHRFEASRRAGGAFDATTRGAAPLIDSYHPSQQNTFTGRLTPEMLGAVFQQARAFLD